MNNTRRWFLLIIVSSAIFLSVIDLFIVNVALPSIKSGIGGTDADMQLVIVAYIIGYASFLITGGKAGAHFGKKKVFLTGMLIFTITSFICGISQSAMQLNVARFVQGISAAFMVPQGMAFIPDLFPETKERIKAFGVYGSIAGTASVIGQFLGGFLPATEILSESWRLIFLINIPFGLIAALLGFKYLKESSVANAKKIDIKGVVLLMFALICFIYPLIQGRELHWPLWSIALLAFSVLFVFAFIYYQRLSSQPGRSPLIDVKVFKNFDFRVGLLVSLFYYLVQDSYFLINTIYLQNGIGVSPTQAGIYFACQGIGYVLASLFFTPLVARYGKYISLIGSVIMIIGLCLHLVVINDSGVNQFHIAAVLFIYGLGCGTILPSLMTISLKSMPESMVGASSGIYLTLQQISVAIGVALVGGVFFQHLGDPPVLKLYPVAYRWGTILNMCFLVIVSVILLFMPKNNKTAE